LEEKDMNLKAFMKEDVKNRGTMEFPGIDKYTDEDGNAIPFIIKRLSMKEINEIKKLYETKQIFRDKRNGDRPVVSNGEIAVIKDYDSDAAERHMMCEAFVQPKLDDPELMEYYGIYDRLEMPLVIFPDSEDYRYADECLAIAIGAKSQKSEKETVEELKN
jgi:hypothetical protein